jgi:hypothetical protein
LSIVEEQMAVGEGSESSLAVSAKPKDLIERVEGFAWLRLKKSKFEKVAS